MNRSVKRIFALTLAAVLVLGTVGCSKKTGDAGTSGGQSPDAGQTAVTPASTMAEDLNPTGEEIIIRVLENDTAKKEGYFEKLLEAFNAAYADQNITAVDADMDEYSDLAQNGPYGYGPDVLYQANDILMKYAADKHVLPITPDEFECGSYIPDAAWDAFKISIDGTTYTCGIPVNIQEPMLYYRKDMLPEGWETEWDRDGNGVPDMTENWNDLYAYSKALRDADDSPNRDSSYGFMASYNDMYMNGEFLFSYGAYVFKNNGDGTFDTKDIGLGAGSAALGMLGFKQFAALMNEGCIDDTITSNRYEKLADGTYFCAVSTPDTYVLFVNKLALHYEDEGMSHDDAVKLAGENLAMCEVPGRMPADGDFSRSSTDMSASDYVDTVVMGGVNGYAISSYTQYRDVSKAFVNFATSAEMIALRMEMLGIAPTRSDVAKESGGTTEAIFTSLAEGHIYLMPSVKELNQVWTPAHTLLSDVAKDAYRPETEQKYTDEASMQAALDEVSKQVYDAIYTIQ